MPDTAGPVSEFARRFGLNLAAARRQRKLSQEEVGFFASLHRTAVGQLERGERVPRLDTAVKLAAVLEVPLASLLVGIAWRPGKFAAGGFEAADDSAASDAPSAPAPTAP